LLLITAKYSTPHQLFFMYGIANSCIPEMITYSYGPKRWNEIKKRNGINDEWLTGSNAYNDELTYKIATVLARELYVGIPQMLHRLGEWWVYVITRNSYASLVKAGGHCMQQFMFNLPLFHQAFVNIHPGLNNTAFEASHITADGLHLHYCGSRAGLKDFVAGMMAGLGKLYNCKVYLDYVPEPNSSRHICKVKFTSLAPVEKGAIDVLSQYPTKP
jgi:hypothetical protein